MEGEALFLPSLERLQTLYPGAYARGSTSTNEGADPEMETLDVEVSVRTHPGAAGFNSFLRGGDPSPTRPSSLVGATSDTLPVTRKSWPDGGSAYGGQRNLDLYTLAGGEDAWDGGKGGDGVGVTENLPPPTHRGEPLAKFFSPSPTHIGTQGGVPTAKSPAHPGSFRGGGWEDTATGSGPPLGDTKI